MADVLLIAPFEDRESGSYVHDALIRLGNRVAIIDNIVLLRKNKTGQAFNDYMAHAVATLKPDITIVLKGAGFNLDTVREMKKAHDHKIVCWIFDVTIGGTLVSEHNNYVSLIKTFDSFYTIDYDAIQELKNKGVNAKWLAEGCDINNHSAPVYNSVQKRKYGGEVVFIGTVGSFHPNREKILKRIHDEGIPLKIYGDVVYKDNEPEFVKDCHTGYAVKNDYHSLVCNASKIVIGIDGWPHRKYSYSARLYRTLCAGGFYLTTNTKGIQDYFTPGKHLDTYSTEDELIEKIIYWLQNDEKRKQIASAGEKLVKQDHTFDKRLHELLISEEVIDAHNH